MFLKKIILNRYNIILINSNLELYSVIRDSIFLLISKIFNKKVITFFHGWEHEFQKKLESGFYGVFKKIFLKSDGIIVLSELFINRLRKWNYYGNTYFETSVIDDSLKGNINLESIRRKYIESDAINILFFSRLEKDKGIYELISAIGLLNTDNDLILNIAGFGSEYAEVEKITSGNPKINFLGYLTGKEKINVLKNSHIMCLPSFSEGMPIGILEGMAFGLPVICTKAGGLNDIIENGENGYFLDSPEPEEIAGKIELMLRDKNNMMKMSQNNYRISEEKFYASKVSRRIEKIISCVN